MAKEDLSKRGKVGETYRSGSFKKAKKSGLKTANLSAAQLKRAQTARGKNVSQKAVKRATRGEATSISDTQFEKGKGVTKNGKLFTGTVKLASGKTATYVRGRRVVAGAKKATGGRGGSGGAGSPPAAKPKANIPTSRVSPSARGEGAKMTAAQAKRFGAEGPKRQMPRSSDSKGIRGLSGYVGRGIGKAGAQSVKRSTGRSTLRGALSAKRSIDTRNQNRNAAAIASLPLLAAGGAAGAGLGAIARAGTAAAAGARSGIAAGAGLAGRPAAARAAAARAAAKQPGTTKGVSKRTGGVLKDGKPATYGPKKPTAAQAAASRRSAAAKKGAATRKANARKRGK